MLARLRQFAHGTQATRADVDGTGPAINFQATTLHIQDKAATCPMLRERYIITVHRLALANITTTCWHINFLPKISTDTLWTFQGCFHLSSVYAYLIIPRASGILHQ